MDISAGKLHQMVTVARTGNLSRAALELNISQPALSRSIAAIESYYGFQLFKRMGHGVELTSAGMQVMELAQPLLQTLRVFETNLKLFGTGRVGNLAIGLAPLLASQELAHFAADFFGSTDRAQLQVMVRAGAGLLEALKGDEIELFFAPEGYIKIDSSLDATVIGAITPVCVVRSSHPLAGRCGLTLTDLLDYPWASSVAPQAIEEQLQPAQFVCDSYHILREAVLRTDLVCICSSAFVAAQLSEGSLRAIEVEGLPLSTTTIYAVRLQGRISSPLAERAIGRMREQLTC